MMGTLVLAVLLTGLVSAVPQQPANPVIGIFTNADVECPPPPPGVAAGTSCVPSYNVRLLEAAGVRVVPFPWNATKEKRLWLAKRVNGVLFPGGGITGKRTNDEYFNNMQEIFDWAIEWNKQGDPFMLWGTCMGFQYINACAARSRDIITWPFPGMEPLMMPLNFTAARIHTSGVILHIGISHHQDVRQFLKFSSTNTRSERVICFHHFCAETLPLEAFNHLRRKRIVISSHTKNLHLHWR